MGNAAAARSAVVGSILDERHRQGRLKAEGRFLHTPACVARLELLARS